MTVGPLPLGPRHSAAAPGPYRGTVESTGPLGISIPKLYGGGRIIRTGVEVAVEVTATAALATGDRVWVTLIEGGPDQFLIFARRS